MTELRRYIFKLDPRPSQMAVMEKARALHCALYNACLRQRMDAYMGELRELQDCMIPPERPRPPENETREKKLARFKAEREAQQAKIAVAKEAGTSKTLSCYDQQKWIKVIRELRPEYATLSSASICVTMERLDLAYKAFFRRAKQGAGASSGFPKFQRADDFTGFGFKAHGKGGWRLEGTGKKRARLYMKGVPGRVRVMGKFPCAPEKIKTCDVSRRADTWWISIVVEIENRGSKGEKIGEIDFNLVDHFAALKPANGVRDSGPDETVFAVSNGRIIETDQRCSRAPGADTGGSSGERGKASAHAAHEAGADTGGSSGERGDSPPKRRSRLGADTGDLSGEHGIVNSDAAIGFRAESGEQKIATIQAAMARCKRGSNRYKKLKLRKARLEAHLARVRRENMHLWTTGIASDYGGLKIVLPESIKETTKSGKGNEKEWGAAVDTKAKLNRHVLDQAPAQAAQMLEYKIAERGGQTEILQQENPPADAGNALVRLAKTSRRTKRTLKKEKEYHVAAE